MSVLATKVKKYLEANSKTWDDTKVSLQNDSDSKGDYIKSWSYNIAQPTDEQLATYNSAATTEENNVVIKRTRRSAYGDIGDQLDEIYNDIDAWKARIKSIKDANPKE